MEVKQIEYMEMFNHKLFFKCLIIIFKHIKYFRYLMLLPTVKNSKYKHFFFGKSDRYLNHFIRISKKRDFSTQVTLLSYLYRIFLRMQKVQVTFRK